MTLQVLTVNPFQTNPGQDNAPAQNHVAKVRWQGEILHDPRYPFNTNVLNKNNNISPEELLAAAHATCLTVLVIAILVNRGYKPTIVDTEATITTAGRKVTGMHLSVTGVVRAITAGTFMLLVKEAVKKCMISEVFSAPITSEAMLSLESGYS